MTEYHGWKLDKTNLKKGPISCSMLKAFGRDLVHNLSETLKSGIGNPTFRALRGLLIRNSNRTRGKMNRSDLAHALIVAASTHAGGRSRKRIVFKDAFPYLNISEGGAK